MELADRPHRPSVAALAVVMTLCAGLLVGCNGVSGYTFDNNGGASGGAGDGTGASSSGGGTSAPTYTLGGTVSGLTAGSAGFTIQDGLGHTAAVALGDSDNAFVFAQALSPGVTYDVTVQTQPDTPPQVCRVSNGTGVMPAAAVTNIAIKCTTPGKYLFAVVPLDTASGTGSIAAFTIDPRTGELTAVPGSPYATAQSHPSDIALDASGQYLYTSNAGSGNVSTDLIGAGGALTLDVSVAATGAPPGSPNANSPLSLAAGSDGTHLYVGSAVSGANGAFEAYTLNGGVLTPAAGSLAASTYPAGNSPQSMIVASAGMGEVLLAGDVSDDTIEDWDIGASGLLTEAPGSPFPFQNGYGPASPSGLAVYPNFNYLYISDSRAGTLSIYAYYSFGHELTPVATYASGSLVGPAPGALVIDPTGSFLYVACSGLVTGFTIDATGNLSSIGFYQTTGTASVSTPPSVRVDPSSQFLYVSNGDAGTISVFKINFDTGALTPVGTPVTARISNGGPSSMAIE